MLSAYAFSVLGDFARGTLNYTNPAVTLDSGGDVFGVTTQGGAGFGSVYEIAKGTNTITTLVSFTAEPDKKPEPPSMPSGGLVMDAEGNLYGATAYGGQFNDGTVYEVATGSNAATVLASLTSAEGVRPLQSLTLDAAGNIYGTTNSSAFELAKGSNTVTVLGTFNVQYGSIAPNSPLVLDASGNLYGTTEYGGTNKDGAIFEISKGTNSITTLASFDGTNGLQPQGLLAMDSAGDLYGSTFWGGPGYVKGDEGGGTLFELAKGSDTISVTAAFGQSGGALGRNPQGGVTMDAARNLYGTTTEGGGVAGWVYEVKSGSDAFTTVAKLDGTDQGRGPAAGVALDGEGDLYGTTSSGGTHSWGTVYELTPNTSASLALSSGSNPSNANKQLVYTATVTGEVPDGQTVVLEDASNNDAPIASGVIVNGSATLTILPGTLSVGTHELIVVYKGDLSHATSFSMPLLQTILPASYRPSRIL